MMVGEIEYKEIFVEAMASNKIAYPYNYMIMITLIIFIILMPILVTNLMVSLDRLGY